MKTKMWVTHLFSINQQVNNRYVLVRTKRHVTLPVLEGADATTDDDNRDETV